MPILKKYLRRYTDLPALIHLLRTERITFLNPSKWVDRNDAYFMDIYKKQKHLSTLLAICCSMKSETYHDWHVFSHGSSGVCISFHRQELVNALTIGNSGIRSGEVRYLKIENIKTSDLEVEELPLVKRAPYSSESEFRFIYESSKVKVETLSFPMPLECIEKTYLSPWMPLSIVDSVKPTLKGLCRNLRIPFIHSTLISNEEWMHRGDEIVKSARKRSK